MVPPWAPSLSGLLCRPASGKRCGVLTQIDKSSGITLHLPPSSEEAQIITSNAMEINVLTAPKKVNGPPVRAMAAAAPRAVPVC